MIETYFNYVFNMSITASYVILAVLFVRLLLKRAPKKYSYLLWSVAGFRLAVPVSFSSVFSLFKLKPFDMYNVHNDETGTMQYMENVVPQLSRVPSVDVGIEQANDFIQRANESSVSAVPPVVSFQQIFSYVWLGVAVLLLAYGIASYVILRIKLSNAVLKKNNIFESDKVTSPFILGFISPKIYIPFDLDDKTYQYVIAHERCHISRCDYYVKAAAFILLAVHWFNPLVWLSFFLMTRDMEMSCDEKVLADNENIRKDYSTAILSFAVNSKFTAVTPLCFSENSVKARIKNVLKYKKPKALITIAAVLLCLAVTVACAANPKEEYIQKIGITTTHDIGDMNIGYEMPKIIYADDENIIMYGAFGVIKYNYEYDIIMQRVDALTIMNIQMSESQNLYVASADGENVYFYEDTNKPRIICIDFKHGYLKEVDNLPDDLYKPFVISDEYIDYSYLNSLECAKVENELLYLRTKDESMKSLELVTVDLTDGGIISTKPVFSEYYSKEELAVSGYDLFAEDTKFISFECSGSYYCFDRENMTDGKETKFYTERADIYGNNDAELLIAEYRGNKTVIFNSAVAGNSNIQICAYIDDALYFNLEGGLYRIGFYYNEEGYIVNSELSFITGNGYPTPVKAEKNILIISEGNAFYSLDTKTGTFGEAEYHVKVSADDVRDVLSAEKAAEKMYAALINTAPDIFEGSTSDEFTTYGVDKNFSPMLIYKPVLMNSDAADPFPDYAWYMMFRDEANDISTYYVSAYINAKTGEVVNLHIEYND